MTVEASAGSESFYRDLPAFTRFVEFTEAKHYRPAPDGWLAVVADIESSTEAIAAGRYKQVNLSLIHI